MKRIPARLAARARRPAACLPVACLPVACLAAACLALAGCSSAPPPAFNPGGPASTAPATPMAQSSGPGSVIMPRSAATRTSS